MNSSPKLLKSRIKTTKIFFICVLLPIFLFGKPVGFNNPIVNEVLRWAGYFLVIICVLGRSFCSVYVGGYKNDLVMNVGPYSIVRNPLYVFSFLGLCGIALQFGSIIMFFSLVFLFLFYYRLVIKKEEQFLEHKFGEKYLEYKRKVPKWIPNFSLWKDEKITNTMPEFVRKTMRDAFVFTLALPAFQIIDYLHLQGFLPYFRIF
jgi:protein-S-isoprenylcysteine O-methyltransferase Ste14